MVRRGVIGAAGRIPQILFPIFTNGTMLDEDYLKLFETYRNLIPVFSIEGDQAKTDQRRGTGVYEKLMEGMESMQKRQLLFGCSVTVTKENLSSVISSEFVESLKKRGCKAVYVRDTSLKEAVCYLKKERRSRHCYNHCIFWKNGL